MTSLEMLGLFWVLLAVTCFSASVLIAAGASLVVGYKTIMTRYRLGEAQEKNREEAHIIGNPYATGFVGSMKEKDAAFLRDAMR